MQFYIMMRLLDYNPRHDCFAPHSLVTRNRRLILNIKKHLGPVEVSVEQPASIGTDDCQQAKISLWKQKFEGYIIVISAVKEDGVGSNSKPMLKTTKGLMKSNVTKCSKRAKDAEKISLIQLS